MKQYFICCVALFLTHAMIASFQQRDQADLIIRLQVENEQLRSAVLFYGKAYLTLKEYTSRKELEVAEGSARTKMLFDHSVLHNIPVDNSSQKVFVKPEIDDL